MLHYTLTLLAFGSTYVTASSNADPASPASHIPQVTSAPQLRHAVLQDLNKRSSALVTGSIESRPDLIGYITKNSSSKSLLDPETKERIDNNSLCDILQRGIYVDN